MDRFISPLKTGYPDYPRKSPVATGYDSRGAYLHFSDIGVMSWGIVKDDGMGIPINTHHGALHYNPVTIAHYGLELYSQISGGSAAPGAEDQFKRVVEWALERQQADGGWPFTFDHHFFAKRVEQLKAPWFSALSQGMMISLITRYGYKLEIDITEPIFRSLNVIDRDVNAGGVKRRFWDKYIFYEEYPTQPESYVLNGFMFCLLGLYDGWEFTKDTRFRQAFDLGVDSLKAMLPLYDLGSGTAYDLTHITSKVEGPNKARYSYHWLHTQLLSSLNVICGGIFDRVVDRWDKYSMGNALMTN